MSKIESQDTFYLNAYFNQEFENIRCENKGIFFAIHEFALAEPDQRDKMNQRVKDVIDILMDILHYGQQKGEFKKFDVETWRHI